MEKKTAKGKGDKSSSKISEENQSALLELFIDGIKDLYWAEKHLRKALPKMQSAATSEELQNAFESHLEQTEEHVARLEEIFKMLEEKPQGKKCDAMQGLLDEGKSIIEETEPGAVRDAGIIAAAQKVEHYEIASYGTLVAFANALGESDAAELLEETLNEEKEADQTLTDIAMSSVNLDAINQPGEE